MKVTSLGQRAPLLWVVVPWITGLVLAHGASPSVSAGWFVVAVGAGVIAVVAASCDRRRVWATALCLCLVCAAVIAYTRARQRLAAWETLPPREAQVQVRVTRTYGTRDARKASGLGRIVASSQPELVGQNIYYSGTLQAGMPAPHRSSVVEIRALLVPLPLRADATTFDGYLTGAGINFKLVRARLLRQVAPPSPYHRFCAATAERFRAALGHGISEKRPHLTALLRAMMLGETREMSEDQRNVFMQSGTMHLFAISGLNIGVIAGAFHALLMLVRLPRLVVFLISTPLLWLFVDITGAAPSAVRAFAMWAFFSGAAVCRRPASPLAAIVGSAALILVVAPFQLFSASFLMSYAIVLSLLLLGAPLAETWLARWSPWRDVPPPTWSRLQRMIASGWRVVVPAVAIGLATALVGTCTSIQFFQLVTPGSLLVNLVLVPAAMIVTLGGFAAIVCGLLGLAAAAALFNHASALVLLVIESLVRHSVSLPGAYVAAEFRAPWLGYATLAFLLIVLFVGYARQWRGPWTPIWAPAAALMLIMLAGVRFG